MLKPYEYNRIKYLTFDLVNVYHSVNDKSTVEAVYAQVATEILQIAENADSLVSENNLSVKVAIQEYLSAIDNPKLSREQAEKLLTELKTLVEAFHLPSEAQMKKAFKKYKPDSLLILGTSDKMIQKIIESLDLPPLEKTIYINEVATEEEMEKARNIRVTQGKHVIPVPTFEIKKDFSGYILDPLQIFKSKGGTPYISEKSIIRPTFSYLGKFTISDSVFRQIAERVAKKMPEIYDVSRIRTQNYGDGISIYLEVIINYGNNIIEVLQNYKARVKKEIEKQTAMNIIKIDLVAKGIHMNEE